MTVDEAIAWARLHPHCHNNDNQALRALADEVERLRAAQKPRPMSDAPDNEYILAKCNDLWLEVIREDDRWCDADDGCTVSPSLWTPLPGEPTP